MTALAGQTWTVLGIRCTDGDTVRVHRQRAFSHDGYEYELRDVTERPIRLVHLDTPERGETGWAEARADLQQWIADHAPGLTLVCFYPDNFGRLLGDLIDRDGNSASQWMLADRGWPPYVPR